MDNCTLVSPHRRLRPAAWAWYGAAGRVDVGAGVDRRHAAGL